MKGKLFKKIQPEGWYVVYNLDPFTKSELRLHPDDLDSEVVRWAENGSLSDKEVEFEIVKKFMADETLWYAKLIKASEYPELEGTIALCEDIINKREAPYISDDFQIGPDGAYEHEEESDWDVTLMDGLEQEEQNKVLFVKDKASYLIESFYFSLPNNGSFSGINNINNRWEEAKRCALIAVEFARKEFRNHCAAEYGTDGSPDDHFNSIKQHIIKK